MRRFVFLLALLVAPCLGQNWAQAKASWNRLEFHTINSVVVDPCHIGLSDASQNHDCTFNEFPDASHTIVVPTATSLSVAATLSGTPSITIVGHYLRKGSAVVTLTFGLSTIAGRCSAIDASLDTVTIPAAFTDIGGTITLSNQKWFGSQLEFEAKPRSLCFAFSTNPTEFFYTGAKWKVAWVTNSANCPPPTSSATPTKLSIADVTYDGWPMNATYIAQRNAQTAACAVNGNLGAGNSQCYNAKVYGCCAGNLYSLATQKCCSAATTGIVQWKDAACPCFANDDCPTSEPNCCLNTKYTFAATYKPMGQCYNSTVHACCNTGRRYDPGSDQCCVINGVQSLDIPCPCSSKSHCNGTNVDCCRQYSPVPWELALYNDSVCSIYANFPNGTGHYSVQPCLGSCINTNFQICCNGVACMKNIEYCCNSTCCNKYVGTCHQGLRPGSPGQWNNYNDFGITFSQCTTIEQLDTIRAFWIFVLPTELMFASFFGLALCLAVAAKASEGRRYSILEVVMMGSAIISILFAITHFFAPIYKYGVVVVLVSLVAIVTSAVRVRWLTILCIFFHIVAVIYLFDFVDGNFYLELNSNRNFATGFPDPATMGVLHSIKKMWPSPETVGTYWDSTSSSWQPGWCTTYYKYFKWDPKLHDTERFENPAVATFGYCSRAWNVALYLFTAGIMDLVVLQLVVDILVLILRYQEASYAPAAVESAEKQVA